MTTKSFLIKPNIGLGDFIGKKKEIVSSITSIGKFDASKSIFKLTCRASKGKCPKTLNKSITLNPIKHEKTLKIYWPKRTSRENYTRGLFYVMATANYTSHHIRLSNSYALYKSLWAYRQYMDDLYYKTLQFGGNFPAPNIVKISKKCRYNIKINDIRS